jgi:hypothetical protein
MTTMRIVLLLFAAFALSVTVGCGLLLQTAVGWHSQETVTKTENKAIEVVSEPSGAQVIRRSPNGQETAIGTAPLTDSIPYQTETTIEHPSVWALVVGGLIEGGASIAAIAAASGSNDSSTQALAAVLGGSTLVFLAIPELIVALVHGLSSDNVVQRKTVGGSQQFLYAGRITGYPDGLALVRVPDQGQAKLVLDTKGAQGTGGQVATGPAKGSQSSGTVSSGSGAAASGAAASGAAASGAAASGAEGAVGGLKPAPNWVIAVMDVEDLNAQFKDRAIDPGLVKNLGDQIRIFVAQRGVRTVDRGAQEKAIQEQISSMKKESYKQCYDDSCQVELGKALAASHILRSRITRFGKRCVLNAELIDLKSEVTMAASSSQGDCEAEGFLTMSEKVATNLLAH